MTMNNLQKEIKECAYCEAGDLEMCENCETKGCPECSEGWRMDSEGCWLCPECYKAISDEWNKHTENGKKVCGTCAYANNDDDEEYIECGRDGGDHHMYEYCKHWSDASIPEN